jgi:hypothetical protein
MQKAASFSLLQNPTFVTQTSLLPSGRHKINFGGWQTVCLFTACVMAVKETQMLVGGGECHPLAVEGMEK